MKNLIIFFLVFGVGIVAYMDMQNRITELNKMSKTNPQIELKKDLLKPSKDRMGILNNESQKDSNRYQQLQFNNKIKRNNSNHPQNLHKF